MNYKYSLSLSIAFILFITSLLNAQEFQGKATYKTHRKMDIKIDSTTMNNSAINSDMQKQLNEMLQKQFQKEYTLTFTASESIYKEEESLSAPQPNTGGMQIIVAGAGGGSDILYKNTKETRFAQKQDVFGKIFLVKDALQKNEWKLENETKNIGQYTCYKATLKREIETFQSISTNGEKKEIEAPKKEEITIVAWYTPEIPVNNGPEMYWGLPGLILEVNDGMQTMVCSKVVLNPKDKIEIAEPTKGKEVSQEKFEAIMEKKSKEMMNRYNREDRDGESIQIEIRG